MKCPDCQAKITAKHYDPDFEWYECPKCGGAFSADEIEEANNGTSPRKRAREGAKAGGKGTKGGKSAARSSGDDLHSGGVSKASVLVAKGKKRRTEIAEDDEAIAKHEAEMLKVIVKAPAETKHRDELPTREVISIMADELEEIYREMGGRLDTVNARDKALILWRELHHKEGIHAREKAVQHVLCGAHSA